jgi:hypothetical protein
LIKSEVIRKIGLFEPKFFLTFEDTDLCFRARKAGYRLFYVPKGVVWHKISTGFGGASSPLYSYYYNRNVLFFIQRHFTGFIRIILYFNVIRRCSRFLFSLYKSNHPAKYSQTKAIFKGISDFFIGKLGAANL